MAARSVRWRSSALAGQVPVVQRDRAGEGTTASWLWTMPLKYTASLMANTFRFFSAVALPAWLLPATAAEYTISFSTWSARRRQA
jgi:hypothetical protein